MFVGGPGRPTSSGRAIHWHADPNVRIEFVATDHERQKIPYVRLVGKDGTVKEYKAEGATDEEIAKGERRIMDCIDCHNVPAHRIAPTAEQAVDAAIANGSISRDLPSVRRESVRLVKSNYSTQEQGLEEIEKGVRGFYAGKAGVDDAALARTVAAVKNVYRRNVFPAMKVTFGVYPDNLGHITSNGCVRCHDGRTASDGSKINDDCEYCHKQIEQPPRQQTLVVDRPAISVGLIRFGGHLSKREYDVQSDGRHTEAASAPPVHGRVQSQRRTPSSR
jgi:hypothetical protein